VLLSGKGFSRPAETIERTFNVASGMEASDGPRGIDILYEACAGGNASLVKWVITTFKFTPADTRSHDGHALMRAVEGGQYYVVKLLLETVPFDANRRRYARAAEVYGAGLLADALRLACAGDRSTIAGLLYDAGLTAEDVRSSGALHAACKGGHANTIWWLAEHLTAEDARVGDNRALREMASRGYTTALRVLVDKFELTAEDARANNNDAIRCACNEGHLETAAYLIDKFRLTLEDIGGDSFIRMLIHDPAHTSLALFLSVHFGCGLAATPVAAMRKAADEKAARDPSAATVPIGPCLRFVHSQHI
jgi:hypothetical protein